MLNATGKATGDGYMLPPIKIVGPSPGQPAHRPDVRVGDMAELWATTLNCRVVGCGRAIPTLTVYYRSTSPTARDYIQFVHLANDASSMAAQYDGPPQGGANPTSSWQPGERVANRVTLQLADAVSPGQYTLAVGLYEAKDPGRRVGWRRSRRRRAAR